EQYRDSTNLQARIDLHARFSTATRDFHAWLFDHFDFSPRAHILEIGCGTGLLW
ncbi:MAG: MerR family transcriptional regulator, partial [Chloroflexi bacterium]|nr:MerR family transcriptional regulator [Chloroflexota bacterium]